MNEFIDFKLTDSERHSALWLRLAEHLNERIDSLRRTNDAPLDHDETTRTRGRIAELKGILKIGLPDAE